MVAVKVDCVGEQCPIPVVKTMRALESLTEPGVIETLVDNEIAVQNVTRMGRNRGYKVSSEKLEEKLFAVRIEADKPGDVSKKTGEGAVCRPDAVGGWVCVIDSDAMGSGDDQLGRTLIKGFIYALSQLEELPSAMLFYNGGAKLCCAGSVSIEDLKSLEAQGVEILICGTCLDFYGLREKLEVGSVTNMYTIAEKLGAASKVVKP